MSASRSDLTDTIAPSWMSKILYAAAVYNLVWGAWIIARPGDLFAMTGIPEPLYPGIWQCVGMIVGVYGIGYAIAATAPYRHWPIVLVGFLGKTLGPIGMLYNFVALSPGTPGRLPWSWAWLNLTNDLIWWLPFAIILFQAFKAWNAPQGQLQDLSSTADAPLTVAQANQSFQTQHGITLAELSNQSPVLLQFLRHSGCTFCREALADLSALRATIEGKGTQIALVHMGDNERDAAFFEEYGMGDVHRISDPACDLYRAYQLDRGKISQLFGAGVWWRGFQAAILRRHGVGKLGGDGFQMGGTFLLHHNAILKAVPHSTAASRPDYCELSDSVSLNSAIGS